MERYNKILMEDKPIENTILDLEKLEESI